MPMGFMYRAFTLAAISLAVGARGQQEGELRLVEGSQTIIGHSGLLHEGRVE